MAASGDMLKPMVCRSSHLKKRFYYGFKETGNKTKIKKLRLKKKNKKKNVIRSRKLKAIEEENPDWSSTHIARFCFLYNFNIFIFYHTLIDQ